MFVQLSYLEIQSADTTLLDNILAMTCGPLCRQLNRTAKDKGQLSCRQINKTSTVKVISLNNGNVYFEKPCV